MPNESRRIRVLPCVDGSVHEPGFLQERLGALARAPGFYLLALALPGALPARVEGETPEVIVLASERLLGAAWANEQQLRRIFSAVPALLLARVADAPAWRRAERLAIQSVLPWHTTEEQFVAAVTAVAAGLAVSPAAVEKERASDLDALTAAELHEELTAREVQVLRLMALGMGNRQIAGKLAISEHTAKFHVSQVLAKLGAASRTEAVSLGITHGLVTI